jgi:predicted RNase H-like HicB family nuclease
MEYFVGRVKVVIEQGEDGYLVASVPSLRGCFSQGRTEDEALRNIKEAISLYVEVLNERGEPVSKEFGEECND